MTTKQGISRKHISTSAAVLPLKKTTGEIQVMKPSIPELDLIVSEEPGNLNPFLLKEDAKKWVDSFEWSIRGKYTKEFGWHYVTQEQLFKLAITIKGFNTKTLEVAGGTGFLTAGLRALRVQIDLNDSWIPGKTTYDYPGEKQWVTPEYPVPIEEVDISSYGCFVLTWPCYKKDWSRQFLRRMKVGDKLILNGEGWGGCTANDAFFYYLDDAFVLEENHTDRLNEGHLQFYGIHDHWGVYRKIR